MKSCTTITVDNLTSSEFGSTSVLFQHGDSGFALGGIDGEALRGLAAMLRRAADFADECKDVSGPSGMSEFALSYEIEWYSHFEPRRLDSSGKPYIEEGKSDE